MTNFSNQHLVIIRTGGSVVNLESYNCQELGLAKALRSKGLKVTLVLGNKAAGSLVVDGVDVIYCKFRALNQQLAWFDGIDGILEKLKPTLIQVHDLGMFMTWKVVRWAKKHNIRSFLVQGNYQATRKPVFKQLELLFNSTFGRYIIKNVTGIGCKTLKASNYVKKYYDRETKLTYVGLDVSRFDGYDNRDWRAELGLQGKKVLLYVGSLERRRNPLFLVDILRALPDDYVLVIVGEGKMQEAVGDKIKSLNLQGRCIMLGKQSQKSLPPIFEMSDAFLLASNYEIYGMVILEAMYFGLPVVSSCTAGSETLIKNGFNGYVINDFSAEEWAACIRQTCEDRNLHDTMSKNCKEYINNNLTWGKVADRYMDLYFDA